MTDQEIQEYLADNGYPAHIVRGGRAGLVRRWQEFADEIERGYPFGIEDYRNDLDVRGILDLIGAGGDPAIRAADDRVKALLTGTDQRIWESLEGNPWWDFGYPRNAGPDLKGDLDAEGML